ncbi:MAG: site-specific DNA-methyltransferase [Ilumatobacteraceae bacterium]
MADEIDVLLQKIEDSSLRSELAEQINRLRSRRSFGLVFQEHLPERVRLPDHPLRRGTKAVRRDGSNDNIYVVLGTSSGRARLLDNDGEQTEMPVADLIVVVEFREPIYPGLARLESIRRGGDKPSHVVIDAENHHALEMLQFTHAGKVDCIYIDPPYNTGARDWKYDNDYVDGDDRYRHSKWLAFMERRLLLAKTLLNPDNAVLIVTIDEHEVHRLRMLLEQTFPSARIQMVTIVVNPKGVAQGGFARVEEYAIYCFFGTAGVAPTDDDYLSDGSTQRNTRFWKGLLRAGTNALPSDGLGMAYPIFIEPSGKIAGTGRTLRERMVAGEIFGDPNEWVPTDAPEGPLGTVQVWPMRRAGQLGVWQAVPDTLQSLAEAGFTKCALRPDGWAISYVPSGIRVKIESGEITVVGYEPSGSAILERHRDLSRAKTVWKRARHDAGWHGAVVLRSLLGGRYFDFPKSLYAVRDALSPVVGRNRDAIILDFFAGTGTTAHAVALLNRLDGGRRVYISVTNNEVGPTESASLSAAGDQPGTKSWELRGIFQSVTMPRIKAAVTGCRPDGQRVDLAYDDESLGSDGFDENVEFMRLTYQDPLAVELDDAFEAVAPLLWLRAGGCGDIIDSQRSADGQQLPFATTDCYGILFDPDQWRTFLNGLNEAIRTVFIVTDSPSTFAGIAGALPIGVEPVRLYASYLQTFRFGHGR